MIKHFLTKNAVHHGPAPRSTFTRWLSSHWKGPTWTQ